MPLSSDEQKQLAEIKKQAQRAEYFLFGTDYPGQKPRAEKIDRALLERTTVILWVRTMLWVMGALAALAGTIKAVEVILS